MKDLSKIKNPHDRYFRASMQDLRVARSFFEANLPQELVRQMDFDTLELKPSSFVSPDLKELVSDLLYSVSLNGELAYLYFLVEHQSSVPVLMPFRKLQYNCALWDLHLKQLPEDQPKLLPVIINVVFYHGTVSPYPESTDIYDCFINPEFARQWALKPFILIDVNQIPDEELAQHKWAALFELMQKHSRERDMLPFLEKLFKGELSLEVHQYGDLLYLMVKYLAETGEISDKRKFAELLKQALPEGEQKMTTLAQDWLKEGEQLGYQKGIHAGIEQMQKGILEAKSEGEHKAKIVVAKNMLNEGASIDFVKKVTGLSDQELSKLVEAH
jgi:predicted transposase/invertase (TIGR01784 family)